MCWTTSEVRAVRGSSRSHTIAMKLTFYTERCPYPNNDHNREILVKRKHQLQAFLPASLHPPADLALTHIEHEALHRTYTNSTTLILSEPLSTIPRSAFYVTEDNYAWDLSELAQAIAANGGVMRNPLSREIFTPGDVRGILAHPLGKVLAPLHAEQQSMAQGVRPETVERLEHLGLVMLGENARDQLGSRMEIDGFQAYVATCTYFWIPLWTSRKGLRADEYTVPDRKQKTIEEFRCPAVDKHSRVAFDSTVGQTLQDAKATELCIHKAGDFVVQAASFLKRAQEEGAVDDEKMENGCVIM